MAHLSLTLLGGFQAAIDSQPLHFPTDKIRALLAYLAVEQTRPHRREALAALLWPDLPDRRARANLRLALHRLRQTVDQVGPPLKTAVLVVTPTAVQWQGEAAQVDYSQLLQLMAAVDAHGHTENTICPTCLAQLETAAAQAQLSLDNLLAWTADEAAVALAEANLATAQANLERAQSTDAAAGNSLTSARVNLAQAERNLADTQKAYNTAFDPARDWELQMPGYKERLEAERNGVTRSLTQAQESLAVARAQYNLAVAGLNNDTAVAAAASLLNAEQALRQAQTGPKASDLAAARLQVTQAELSLQQAQFNLHKAEAALADTRLVAPSTGTVLSVDVAVGAVVGAGTPIISLRDTDRLQFHTNNLSERDLGQVRPGQSVEIVLKSFPTRPITGTVTRIAPQASGVVGDGAVFTVMIDLEPTDLPLLPGMTGRAGIKSDS
jgi:multidrug resistance efflux pump